MKAGSVEHWAGLSGTRGAQNGRQGAAAALVPRPEKLNWALGTPWREGGAGICPILETLGCVCVGGGRDGGRETNVNKWPTEHTRAPPLLRGGSRVSLRGNLPQGLFPLKLLCLSSA